MCGIWEGKYDALANGELELVTGGFQLDPTQTLRDVGKVIASFYPF